MAIDSDLVAFVRRHVRSVWALELLLLLRRDPARRWTSLELVRELRASTSLVSDNLQRFEAGGLVVRQDKAVRYAPSSPVLEAYCVRLEAAYRKRPVAVINLIAQPQEPSETAPDRLRRRGQRG